MLMKKILLSLLCFIGIAITANAQDDNLLSNSSFEEWADGKPTDWATLATSNATIEQSSDAHSGSSSVAVMGATSNKRFTSKSYTLEAGTYTLSAYVKANGEEAGYYRLGYAKLQDGVVVDTSSDYIYSSDPATAAPSEWEKVSYEFNLPETTELTFIAMNHKNGNLASFLIDDMTLVKNSTDEGGDSGNTETPDETEISTIAEIIAAGAGNAKAKGTIVATYSRGFLLSDNTGRILVFLNGDKGYAAGDVVTVNGATSMYGGMLQFGSASTVEKTGTASYEHPSVTVIEGSDLDSYLEEIAIEYVEYSGTLTISNYYNVAVEGAEKAIGSIQYPQAGVVTAKSGDMVKVTGYIIGVSGSKYVNTMATKVEVVKNAETEEVKEYTVTEAIAAYTDGEQIPAIVVGYIVGAVDGYPDTGGSQFSDTTSVTTNIILAENGEETDYKKCLIVQLPKGDIRDALNLADNKNNYKAEVKITGSIETYFKMPGLKNPTHYEFTGNTGIVDTLDEDKSESIIFDLTGRRINNITKPGIYIINGKKRLIK